ncbi:S-adenosylmethionine-dependent methyltransferase Rv2258c-like isoform X2 [Babylonia areolata]
MATETHMVECLCTAQSPLSSADMADQLKLKERYVREVLNSLTVVGLVQLEEGTGGKERKEARYLVPPACRPGLQRASTLALIVSSNARNFDNIKKCFDHDGPYAVRYQAASFTAMDKIVRARQAPLMEALLETPDLKHQLEKGLRALDVGCGTARLSLHMASLFPNSHFTLTDLMPEPLEKARQHAEKEGLTNVTFQLMDVCQVPDNLKESFDWVMCRNVIHDLPYPLEALKGIFKVLKPGGQFCMLDAFASSYVAENRKNYRVTAAMYADSTFNCIPESYQQPDSAALGNCWGIEKATELVEAAGMKVLGLTRVRGTDIRLPGVCVCLKPE